MFYYKNEGKWEKTFKYLDKVSDSEKFILKTIYHYSEKALNELKENTPRDTGLTAKSWSYEVYKVENGYSIIFKNSNLSEGISVVILIENGHLTKSGNFVEGRPFVNRILDPIFNDLINDLWKELS